MSQAIETIPSARPQQRPFLTTGEAGALTVLILIAGVLLGAFILPSFSLLGIVLASLVYLVAMGMTLYLLVLAFLDARKRTAA